jgi:CRP/FNR family transcriptional regulator, cyclic AMP receptor protein
MKDHDYIYNCLRINSMFHTIPTEQLREITYLFNKQTYNPGDYIFLEGETKSYLCLVSKGLVAITKKTAYGDEAELAVLDKNDFFGELELLDGLPRSANAKAL